MEETAEQRENLEILIQKYEKNKKQVPRADLQGKYHAAFTKLRDQIKEEAEHYLSHILLEGGILIEDNPEGWQVIDDINALLDTTKYGAYIGNAIFKNYSLKEAEEITQKYRDRIRENILGPYYEKKHIHIEEAASCPAK